METKTNLFKSVYRKGERMHRRFFVVALFSVIFSLTSIPAFAGRPLITEEVDTLPPGDIELELGFEYLDDPQIPFSGQEISREFIKLPALGLNIGLGEIVEVQADFEAIYLDQPGIDKEYAHGDLRLWTKIKAAGEGDLWPALGMRFGTKLPNAGDEDGRGTDETDFFISMLLSKHFGNIYTHLNLGLGILGDPNQRNSQDDVMTYGLGIEIPLEAMSLRLVAEVNGQAFSNEHNNISSARGGIQYEITDNLLWDVFGSGGITSDSEDWSAGTGFTYRFKAFSFSP
jgi:hypothetical protein